MARAEIYVEDREDGQVDIKYRYLGGADPRSGAHQIVNAIRRWLDEAMTQAAEPVMTQDVAPLDTGSRLVS